MPKIHKSLEIKSAIDQERLSYVKASPSTDQPLRPMAARATCPTYCLSKFLDIILKPLCKHMPSYIRGDLDLLSHIPTEVE